jgi:hypothetical protein
MAIRPLDPNNPVAEWTDDMTLILIQQRRQHQQLFDVNTRHNDLWTRIANYIRRHNQYEITARQCQVKWYALKSGYENLKRLLSENPDEEGYEIRSPNWHDRIFYDELSDEFWHHTGN